MAAGELSINQFSGVKALWHLENVNDSSPNAYNLTNNNSVTFTPGRFGNAANLGTSNTNKSLTHASDLGLDFGGNNSISLWIKLTTEIGSGEYCFFTVQDTTNKVGFQLGYEYNSGTRRIYWDRSRFGVANDRLYLNTTLGTSVWINMILTYDGATVRGYLNGDGKGDVASSGNGNNFGSEITAIGSSAFNGSQSNFASAIIDEVVVASTLMTPKQIKDYYAWAVGRRTNVA